MLAENHPALKNEYTRLVRPEGNPAALALMDKVLCPAPSDWRGLGHIEDSGYAIREAYAPWDAMKKFSLDPPGSHPDSGLSVRSGHPGCHPPCRLSAVPERLLTVQSGGALHGIRRGCLRRSVSIRIGMIRNNNTGPIRRIAHDSSCCYILAEIIMPISIIVI